MMRTLLPAVCGLVLSACGPGTGSELTTDTTITTGGEPSSATTTDMPTTTGPTPTEATSTTGQSPTEATGTTPGTASDTTSDTTSGTTSATSSGDTTDGLASTGGADTTTTTGTTGGPGDTGTSGGSSETGQGCAVVETLMVDDATDLDALGCIEEVLGDAQIGPTTQLTSLAPLKNLRRVGGGLLLVQNHGLKDLSGLDALEEIGGWFRVLSHDGLVTMAGLEKLTSVGGYIVAHNPALTALSPLGGAVTLTAPGNVHFTNLPQLKTLGSLAGLKLKGAFFDIYVELNPALTTLAGLGDCCSGPNGMLHIHDNPALASLVGLEQFTNLFKLEVTANDKIKDLTGLGGLKSVDMLSIGERCYMDMSPDPVGNASLVTLDGMNALTQVESIEIVGNPKLPEALAKSFAAKLGVANTDSICENLGGSQCPNFGPCPQ